MNKRNKILIDASTLTARVDGLAVYTTSLIKALAHDWAEEFAFTVLLNPDVDWPEISESENNGLLSTSSQPLSAMWLIMRCAKLTCAILGPPIRKSA